MTRRRVPNVLLLAALSLAGSRAAPGDDRVEKLPEAHRSWIEREVVYIVTDRERDVFLSLGSDEERERFIEAFWSKRDPNLATPVNEFREEHYRRLEYADRNLARETYMAGWRTDRGRYYIILGEPRQVQRFDGYSELVSSELWFYQGEPQVGVPSFFYLLFFRMNDGGEYRLYHPIADGPQALLTGGHIGSDNRVAVEVLRQISPELAAASLSFDTNDPSDYASGRPALGHDILLRRIEESPKRAIRTDYADAWVRYGDRVSAEYSFNFVPSRSTFFVSAHPSGTPLVHFTVEVDAENFALETDEARTEFETTLDVTVEARAEDGTLVRLDEQAAHIELPLAQLQQVLASPFAYQDSFPLLPGTYTVNVVLRNRVSKEYTVAEREIEVPSLDPSAPAIVDLLLAFDSRDALGAAAQGDIRAFQVGALRFQPAADGMFVIGDTVHVVAQAYGAGADHRVEVALLDEGRVVRAQDNSVGDQGMVLDHLRLDDLAGGSYEVRVRLLDASGAPLSESSAAMTVSPRSVAIRPTFLYRRGINTQVPGLLPLLRGEQLWALGRHEEARAELERAVASGNDQLPEARWKLAHAYLVEGRSADALSLLRPLESDLPRHYDVVSGIGFALHLQEEFEEAVRYLERALEIRPPDTRLLNVLADCLARMGRAAQARDSFERSLALDPEQPEVMKRLRSLTDPR